MYEPDDDVDVQFPRRVGDDEWMCARCPSLDWVDLPPNLWVCCDCDTPHYAPDVDV